MADHAVPRRIGAAVVSLAALGTAAVLAWSHPRSASGDRTRLRAGAVMAPLADSTPRGADPVHPGTGPFFGSSPPADYTPITQTVKGRVGDTVVVRLGVMNLGPGDPVGDPGAFQVVPPPGTTITSIPWAGDDDDARYACAPPSDKEDHYFLCDLSQWGTPGPTRGPITVGFHIRIDQRIPGAEGCIFVFNANDPVPGNNRAAIPVEAAPAPARRRWQPWTVAAGALALVVLAGRRFVRRRRTNRRSC